MKFLSKIMFAGILLLASCSVRNNTAGTRVFHKFTSHYNTYFNGNESFKEGVVKAEKNYPQTFDELLPVFAFNYDGSPNLVTSEMDRAISKCTKLIENHSITAKPKLKRKKNKALTAKQREFYNRREFNEQVAPAHLMIAKSHAYMHNYINAAAVLEYMDSQYAKRPIISTSKLWKAVVSTESGYFDIAEKLLKESSAANLSKKELFLYNSAWANLLIKQQNYKDAIFCLQYALNLPNSHDDKIRYTFLLGQLYEKTGVKDTAAMYFTKVAKMNAPYAVTLNAQLCMAKTFNPKKDSDKLSELYNKMLKNKQNFDYQDQIYYALGNLAEQNGNTDEAIKYYNLSIEKNAGNQQQLGISHATLADIYFEKPDYVKSYNNYKEAASSLSSTHSRRSEILSRIKMMNLLAPNLAIVQHEDSLQNFAKMPETARNAMVDSLIAVAVEKKEAAQKEQQAQNFYIQQADLQKYGVRKNAATIGNSSGNWYFYNISQVNQGAAEFNMRWGRRKLEDNWRRKNKSISTSIEDEETGVVATSEAEDAENTQVALSPESREYYLQDVPLTPEAMKKSNEKLAPALFNVAIAYEFDMNDNARATAAFEDFIKRFPKNENTALAYFNLYKIYSKAGNTSNADVYKNKLIGEYPNSELAQAAKNPNYFDELQVAENNAEAEYAKAFDLYKSNKDDEAFGVAQNALSTYADTKAAPRLDLMRVLTTNYNGDIAKYKENLNEIAQKYPNSTTSKTANDLLKIVELNESEIVNYMNAPDDNLVYAKDENGTQAVVLLVNKRTDVNKISSFILLFNTERYSGNSYETHTAKFNDTHNVIIVLPFLNKTVAENYYKDLTKTLGIKEESENGESHLFVISTRNLQVLIRNRNIDEYLNFAKTNN